MLDINEIKNFIVKSRLETYTSNGGYVQSVLFGTKQLEYRDGDMLYRDIFYIAKNSFNGIEAVYVNDKPVFSTSYYGNWGSMTEQQTDIILRGALVENPETRLNNNIEWHKDGYIYACEARFTDDINRLQGVEKITKDGEQIYEFTYIGGMLV